MVEKKRTDRIALIILFTAWLIFNGILLVRHELWRDEANVWLMARDLSPWELLREIKYQGHPCLWYLLIMPFAKVGLPFRTIGVISFLIMTVTTLVFLKKASLCIPIKGICILSPIFTYFYSDIARNYCLIALLMILLAWCFPKRNEKSLLYGLLLGLLVQADTIALATAGMLSFVWVCEGAWKAMQDREPEAVRKVLKGVWIPFVSLLFWIFQFYRVSDSPEFSVRDLGIGELFQEIKHFGFAIFERMTGWEKNVSILFLLILLITMLVVSVKAGSLQAVVVLTVTFLFQTFFSAVIYQLHMWHYISLCFVLIWSIWILQLQLKEKKCEDKISKGAMWILEFLLGIYAICMLIHWNSDRESSNLSRAWNGVYSDGIYTAEYIEDHVSQDELIVSDNIPMASTVLAYLKDYQFYYAGSGKLSSYADWSKEQSQGISFTDLIMWVKQNFPGKGEFYLLHTEQSCISEAEALEDCLVLYRTEEDTVRGEEYVLYKIDMNAVIGDRK